MRLPPFLPISKFGMGQLHSLIEETYHDQESYSRNDSEFCCGVGIGAVAALLLAPKSGEELQGNLAEGVNDRFNQVRGTGKDLKRRAQEVLDLARDQVEDAVNAGDSAYNQAKNT
jgi:hypothetical protein